MKACCPICDTLAEATPGPPLAKGERNREYTVAAHPRPVCRRCRSRVVFGARELHDVGTWVCALHGEIVASDVDHDTGPICKGRAIR